MLILLKFNVKKYLIKFIFIEKLNKKYYF